MYNVLHTRVTRNLYYRPVTFAASRDRFSGRPFRVKVAGGAGRA